MADDPDPAGSAPTASPVKVLVVDDQPRFRAVVRTVVDRTPGFELVGEAADGAAATELAVVVRPDLVLMDIHMPVLDGIEATRRVVAARPEVIVVLLSSYDRADLPVELADTGAADYLHKEELAPDVLAALWRRHSARSC